MECAAIMTTNPPTVRETDSVATAAAKLIAEKHLALPVVDAEGRYVGMFGTDDLMRLVVPRVAIAGNVDANLRFVRTRMRCAAGFFELPEGPGLGIEPAAELWAHVVRP